MIFKKYGHFPQRELDKIVAKNENTVFIMENPGGFKLTCIFGRKAPTEKIDDIFNSFFQIFM